MNGNSDTRCPSLVDRLVRCDALHLRVVLEPKLSRSSLVASDLSIPGVSGVCTGEVTARMFLYVDSVDICIPLFESVYHMYDLRVNYAHRLDRLLLFWTASVLDCYWRRNFQVKI